MKSSKTNYKEGRTQRKSKVQPENMTSPKASQSSDHAKQYHEDTKCEGINHCNMILMNKSMGSQTCQLVTKSLYKNANQKWYQMNDMTFQRFEAYKRSWHEVHEDHTLSSKGD